MSCAIGLKEENVDKKVTVQVTPSIDRYQVHVERKYASDFCVSRASNSVIIVLTILSVVCP